MKPTLHYSTLFLIAACLLLMTAEQTYAQWTTDPAVNNAISTATGNQEYPTIVSDGTGGAIITWSDNPSGNSDIYAQRINASGTVQWTANGDTICTATGGQFSPTVVSDGTGGAIITWSDNRSGNSDIYAQRINASGIVQWTANGDTISTATGIQSSPTIVSDGAEGAIITWSDNRSGAGYDIYAQRINASGIVQWTANGVEISTATGNQSIPTVVSDGTGGAIITWHDRRNISQDIYAQRINASGTVQWTANGVAICTATDYQEYPTIVSDGSGGAIITWYDYRNGNGKSDIYAQHINASGTVQWTANGVAICTATGNQSYPTIVSDGTGGAIMMWNDRRSGAGDIYAQRINASGIVQWTANGDTISTATGDQFSPTVVSDGTGGAIITWYDGRSGNHDIYAQRINEDGALPVELVSFTAQALGTGVELAWNTATEVNNYGFEVERRTTPLSPPSQGGDVRGGWTNVGFVEGHGTTNAPMEYSFTDEALKAGRYSYRLKQIDRDGKFEYSKSVEVTISSAPKEFALMQNYPNPFNPTTTINYQLPVTNYVSLKVYDAIGREVATLVNEVKDAGYYSATFDAPKLSSGMYFYTLTAGSFTATKKQLLIK